MQSDIHVREIIVDPIDKEGRWRRLHFLGDDERLDLVVYPCNAGASLAIKIPGDPQAHDLGIGLAPPQTLNGMPIKNVLSVVDAARKYVKERAKPTPYDSLRRAQALDDLVASVANLNAAHPEVDADAIG